ncbi:MAG: hypothetical protein ABSA26_08395, partial [Thermoguttaceae bacterium]
MNEVVIARLRETLTHITADSPNRAYITAAEILASKTEVISKYGPIFALQNLDNLTAEEFRSFLLFRNNHHWDSLHRQGGLMTADMGRLRKALKILVNESIPIRSRLDQIRPNSQEGMVKGLGRAVITAILQVEYPDKYGVVNNTAESGMKALGLWPERERGASFGERYETVNQILVELAQKMGVDLWTLDTLWWLPAQDVEEPESTTTPMTEGVFGLERYLHEFLVDNWERLNLG